MQHLNDFVITKWILAAKSREEKLPHRNQETKDYMDDAQA